MRCFLLSHKGSHHVLRLLSLLLALSLLSVTGCTAEPDVVYDTTPPTLSDDELPTPEPYTVGNPDTTDYPALASAVFADATPAPESDFSYEQTEGGVKLTAYLGSGGTLVLPDTVDGAPVVALAAALFKDNTAITALAIPESVQSIGTELLSGCRSLQVIKTPQLGATRTSEQFLAYLFGGTTPINGAFKIGSALDTVILTDSVQKIDRQAFFSCYRLIMVILPESVKEIGSFAFSGCSNLKYAALPDSLTTLGDGAFSDCTSLTYMSVPDSVTRIGLGAFMGCSALGSMSLPFVGESTTQNNHLGYVFGAEAYTFNRDFMPAKLRAISVRHGSIPNYAFYECDRLYAIELPSDCTTIGVRAFHGCSSLLSLTVPDSVTHIEDMAFSDCRWLTEITLGSGLLEIGMQAFMSCINLREITLPDEVTILSPSLFANCKRLTTVTVSDKLTTVDDAVFRHCISLASFQTSAGTPVDANRVAIGRDNDALIACGVLPEQPQRD